MNNVGAAQASPADSLFGGYFIRPYVFFSAYDNNMILYDAVQRSRNT